MARLKKRAATVAATKPVRRGRSKTTKPRARNKENEPVKPTVLIGRQVEKAFGNKKYLGVIQSIDREVQTNKMLYHVIYQDNDEEDMHYEEIVTYLVDGGAPRPETPYERHLLQLCEPKVRILAIRTDESDAGFWLARRRSKPVLTKGGHTLRIRYLHSGKEANTFTYVDKKTKDKTVNVACVLPVYQIQLTNTGKLTNPWLKEIRNAVVASDADDTTEVSV